MSYDPNYTMPRHFRGKPKAIQAALELNMASARALMTGDKAAAAQIYPDVWPDLPPAGKLK